MQCTIGKAGLNAPDSELPTLPLIFAQLYVPFHFVPLSCLSSAPLSSYTFNSRGPAEWMVLVGLHGVAKAKDVDQHDEMKIILIGF